MANKIDVGFELENSVGTYVCDLSTSVKTPITQSGDLIVGGNNGKPAVLHKGTAGQVLKVNSDGTGLEYGDVSSSSGPSQVSVDLDIIQQLGDLIVGDVRGHASRLPSLQTAGYLRSSHGVVSWSTLGHYLKEHRVRIMFPATGDYQGEVSFSILNLSNVDITYNELKYQMQQHNPRTFNCVYGCLYRRYDSSTDILFPLKIELFNNALYVTCVSFLAATTVMIPLPTNITYWFDQIWGLTLSH